MITKQVRSTLGWVCVTSVGTLSLAGTSAAQGTGNAWVEFTQENSRLSGENSLLLQDTQEKDYAWGDLDKDGWTDLVAARKQPFTTSGRQPNVLLMNENGVLTDRTALYASASSVSGDSGMLTATNDRDVTLTDVDGDGWLDVVTATTLSQGQPKHISHPRVYMNLGEDGGGNWLGLRFEDDRFPQILFNGNPVTPDFCSVSAGDVTGDGRPDLYFAHYATGGSPDIEDKLFINDGSGFFADEGDLRMTNQMRQSGFGASSDIQDMNGDGLNDVVKQSNGTPVSASYQDPDNLGFFDVYDGYYSGAPYHMSVGDLNQDGRLDTLVSDDGLDRHIYNTGTDIFGRAIWGPAMVFAFAGSGFDDGFASNNLVADLDLDGWPEAIFCDVDVDISGCGRRAHIYHNPGGVPGQQIQLREEAQQNGSGGWKGVVGITAGQQQGTHDIAVFDVDNDGAPDMVFGRCSGTNVWINTMDVEPDPVGTNYCFCDGSGTAAPCGNSSAAGVGCANSSGQGGLLEGFGSASVASDDLSMTASSLLPGQPALLFSGADALNGGNGFTFGDGLRCAGTSVLRHGASTPDGAGVASWPAGLAGSSGFGAGDTRYFQAWYRDPAGGGVCGSAFNLSNGVEVQFTN